MRVRADGDHAGPYEAFFRKQCMLDTDTPLLEIIDNAVFMREVTDDLCKSGRLDILCRLEMIRNENDLLLVEYRDADAIEFRNGRRRGDIIRHDQVKAAVDQIPCFHRIDTGMLGQDLLCHCHTHTISSSAISHFCCNKKNLPSRKRRKIRGTTLIHISAEICTLSDNGQVPARPTLFSLRLEDEFDEMLLPFPTFQWLSISEQSLYYFLSLSF